MRMLVLGGTAWLGHHIASAALDAGHDVTCLARGESGSVPRGAVLVRGDRDEPGVYDTLADPWWDAVVDVSMQPGHVRRAAEELSERSQHFVFISSGSVYADTRTPDADESAGLLPPLAADTMDTLESYGEAKVACENHVVSTYGRERSAIVRPGLIGGPGDTSGRTGYWPWRFAHPASVDGAVLLPDAPDQQVQVIDVRDLAFWVVELAAHRTGGVFNATGDGIGLADHLERARSVAGHSGPVVPVDQEWIQAHEVNPWMGERSLPLWLPQPEYAGFGARDNRAARAAGLVSRALEETLADVLEWEDSLPDDRSRRAGLSDDDERALLAAVGHQPT